MISSITFLIQLFLVSVTLANDISFKNINIIDSYTRTQNCTDLSHFFLIQAELSIKKGSYNDDIFFNVPTDFDFFPTIPLNISNKGQQIASVYEHANNMFGIHFTNIFPQDTTISFDLLTKLSNSSMSHINIGDKKNFTFRTTANNVFNSTLHFVGKDTTKMTTNGGSFANNETAWFTADIPVSLLGDAVTFKSFKTGSNDYKYNVKSTKLEVVTSFDSYGNPLTTVPFTAYTDKSTADQIEISIDTRISGSGKFVRIFYFTEELDKTPISNAVSLTQANYLKKRDLVDSTTVTVYGGDLNDEAASNVVINTPVVASSSVITGHVATPIYSNNTYLSTASLSGHSDFSSSFSQQILSEISTVIPTGLIKTTNTTETETTITVAPTPTYFNQTVKPSIITSDNVIETYEVLTYTDGAIVTEIGSYVPVATIKPTTRILVDAIFQTEATKAKSNSTIVQTNTTSDFISEILPSTTTSIFSNTTSLKTKIIATRTPIASRYIANVTNEYYTDVNGVVESKTLGAVLSATTELVPVKTFSNSTVIKTTSTEVSGSAVIKTKQAIGAIYTQLVPVKSIQNRTTISTSCSTETGATAITKTKSEQDAVYTQLVPVRAIHNLTTTISCSTETGATAITKTDTGIKSTGTSLVAIGTISNKTSTLIGKIVSSSTIAPVNSVYTDIVPLSTLSTKVKDQTSSTETLKHALTKTISPVKVTSTEVVAIGTIKATKQATTITTIAAPSIQMEAPKSIDEHTTISVRPYEAGSNKLALGLSSFIIAMLTTLF